MKNYRITLFLNDITYLEKYLNLKIKIEEM